ncbi:MAG: ATP-binding protein, partial [Bdellovibrionales bacterium]
LKKRQPVIVITGGPSGGKTTLIEAIKRELAPEVITVPEAASLLYRGGFPRGRDTHSQVRTQKAIYYVQEQLEGLAQDQSRSSTLVCDRGSLDGLAYWPENHTDYFEELETNLNQEISRYDWVLHLDTAHSQSYDLSNPVRTENYEEAWKLNERIKWAWSQHPQVLIVSANSDFFSKMALCLHLIRGIIDGRDYESIKRDLP